MSSPPNAVPEPVIGLAMLNNSVKSYNFATDDNRSLQTPANSSALTNANIKRYSRSELYLIRNGNRSSRRPECALRAELQSLGVWKFNTGPPHQNGHNMLGDGGVLVSSHLSLGAGSSASGHLSVRSQRSPAARDHSSITASSIASSSHGMVHHVAQKTYIDHRSISSSHLMPAFAKRRIAASTAATSSATPNSASASTYGGNSPADGRACTPTDVKDGLLRNVGSAGSSNLRQRGEYRPRGNTSDEHGGFQSPQRKVLLEFERDRERQRDREHEYHSGGSSGAAAGGRLSPLTVTNVRHGGHGSILHERRIGSGRLLARDVSWDYRSGSQDKDKNQSSNVSTVAADKDSVTSSHLLQQRSRHADKLHEQGTGSYTERRSYDRRSAADDSLRDKFENLNVGTASNGRRFAYNDAYGSEPTVVGQQQSSASHGRNRRGHQYNDRNEEPEWFSGGPTSQNDTIELRGFEEIDEPYNAVNKRSSQPMRKLSESSSSRASSTLNLSSQKSKEQPQNTKDCSEQKTETNPNSSPNVSASSDEATESLAADEDQSGNESRTNGSTDQANSTRNSTNGIGPVAPSGNVLPNFMLDSTNDHQNSTSSGGGGNNNSLKFTTKQSDFNFDAFLNPNVDPLEHTLMCGDVYSGNDSEAIGSSRFSRWFGNTAKVCELQPLHDVGDSTSNISDNTNVEGTNQLQNNAISFMEFLQRSKLSTVSDIGLPPKAAIPSVGELEARMRKMDCNNELSTEPINANALVKLSKDHDNPLLSKTLEASLSINHQPPQTSQPQPREMEAFKKLLEQLGSGNKQPPQQSQSSSQTSLPSTTYVSISMMVPQQQQQNRAGASQPVNMLQVASGSSVPASHPPQQMPPPMLLKNEEFKKFLQHQHTLMGQQQQHQKQLQNSLTLPPHVLQHNHHQLPPPMSPQNLTQSGLNDITAGIQLPQQSQQQPPMHMPLLFAGQSQKRIEVQQLLQWVSRGEMSLNFLEQELNNPNTTPHAKEVISAVLRESSRSVTPSTGLNANLPPPPPQTQQPLTNIGVAAAAMQQQQNQHQRLHSPIPLGGNGTGPGSQCPPTSGACSASQQQQQTGLSTNSIMPVSCNTQNPNGHILLPGPDQRIPLSASGQTSIGNQGLPSQRDLQFHTQAIMQNAMFKKKLEEQQQQQQESLKRRQELQKQHQQQQANIVIGSVALNEIDMQSKNLQQLHIATNLSMQQQQPPPASVQQAHMSHGLQQQPHQYQQHLQQRRINSPTPLAFTPTSVLRKMTADKDNTNANASHQQLQQPNVAAGVTIHQQQQQNKGLTPAVFVNVQQQLHPSSQPRMILGGNHSQQQQTQVNNGGPPQISPQTMPSQLPPSQQPPVLQQMRSGPPQIKWPGHLMNQQNLATVTKPMGRPILKGPLQAQPQPAMQQQMSQLSQLGFPAKLEFQQMQQQRLKNSNQAAQQMITQTPPQPFPHTLQSQHQQQQKQTPQTHNNVMTHVQQQQQLFHQHQQRALALQRQQLQLQQQQIQHHHHQQHQPLDAANRNMVLSMPPSISDNSVGMPGNNPAAGIINYQRDGALSPTSNQLAQWFSPELLAQASAGKLPLLNMNQTLSLEEFERSIQHSSTAVHN